MILYVTCPGLMIHCIAAAGKKCVKVARARLLAFWSAPWMPRAVTFGVSEGKIAPTLLSYSPREASTRACASLISMLRAMATRTTVGKSIARRRRSYMGGICDASTFGEATREIEKLMDYARKHTRYGHRD